MRKSSDFSPGVPPHKAGNLSSYTGVKTQGSNFSGVKIVSLNTMKIKVICSLNTAGKV